LDKASERHERRRADREYLGELYRQVVAWDPLGLIELGAPYDEYDSILGPLASGLSQGIPPEMLAVALRARFLDRFDMEPTGAEDFAVRITNWYRTART
jgi:hypothetical protein